MSCLVFASGRLMEDYMWNRWLFMSASNLEMLSYATRHAAKALADAAHRQLIPNYRNTAMQQNSVWSIAFEACSNEILNEVY
jgi:hypothetical protein